MHRISKLFTNTQSGCVCFSAGVGRTGTFIALNHLSDEITEREEINIAVIVGKMRARRPDMVQTLVSLQYHIWKCYLATALSRQVTHFLHFQ